MLNGSIGRCATNGCHSTIGLNWQRFKTLQRSGCGLTTMTAPIWPWADSHQSSDWPWLRNVSTSATLAKGEDYQLTRKILIFYSLEECLPCNLDSLIDNAYYRYRVNLLMSYSYFGMV